MTGILFVLDKSGSMSWGLNGGDQIPPGQRRIDYAKAQLNHQLSQLPDNLSMGLVIFPCYSPCDVGVLVPIGANAKSSVIGALHTVDAPWTTYNPQDPNKPLPPIGGTPLAEAINTAGGLAKQHGKGINVVVLTDGEETCGGDPVGAANYWRAQGIDLRINVIGFAVTPYAQKQLSAVAKAGGGDYYRASDAPQLQKALKEAVQRPQCPSCGGEVSKTANACKHCGHRLKEDKTPQPRPERVADHPAKDSAEILSLQPVVELHCPDCSFNNRAGVKYCEHCGVLLPVVMVAINVNVNARKQPDQKFCKQCGAKVREGIRFCENCGAELKGRTADKKTKG
jgi:hypothetical protein